MITVTTDPDLPCPIPLTPMAVFPTYGSLQEVIDTAVADLPITSKNELVALFAIYHNTILNQLGMQDVEHT